MNFKNVMSNEILKAGDSLVVNIPAISAGCETSANMTSATMIFTDYGSFMRAVIKTRVKDEHTRNDIYHDFFLSLVKKPIPENISNIKSYLYKAICNDICDSIRKLQCYDKHIQKHGQRKGSDLSEPPADEKLTISDEACRMFEIIETNLTSGEANVIKLKYQKELNNNEIAESLNIGGPSVSTYFSTGLKKLRKIIKNEERE